MYNGSNLDRKSPLSEILTEPLNLRADLYQIKNRRFSGFNSHISIIVFLQ